MSESVVVRETREDESRAFLDIHRAAFGHADEAELVKDLLTDSSARPCLSLVAVRDDRLVGHILFTRVHLKDASREVPASLLAPLAVLPELQRRGIGGQLIEEGLLRLGRTGVELVFVLGYPDYYSRHGFAPAGRLGFEAPYPIAEENADAWMVQELKAGMAATLHGQVVCARTLDKEEYWRE